MRVTLIEQILKDFFHLTGKPINDFFQFKKKKYLFVKIGFGWSLQRRAR